MAGFKCSSCSKRRDRKRQQQEQEEQRHQQQQQRQRRQQQLQQSGSDVMQAGRATASQSDVWLRQHGEDVDDILLLFPAAAEGPSSSGGNQLLLPHEESAANVLSGLPPSAQPMVPAAGMQALPATQAVQPPQALPPTLLSLIQQQQQQQQQRHLMAARQGWLGGGAQQPQQQQVLFPWQESGLGGLPSLLSQSPLSLLHQSQQQLFPSAGIGRPAQQELQDIMALHLYSRSGQGR